MSGEADGREEGNYSTIAKKESGAHPLTKYPHEQ